MKKDVLTAPALEALMQAPSLAIHAVDKQGRVIFWSPSASRMFGWTESEVLGRFLPIVPEDRRQEVYDRIQRDLKGESISPLDVRRVRKDGSLVDISLWSAPLRDTTGEIIGILGLYADITARKQGEQALQKSQAELQEVLAAVSDYIWSGQIDSDGRFSYRYNSPSVERILGRPAEFFRAGPGRWLSIVHPEDRARAAQAADRLRTGQSASDDEEYRIVLPDGAIRWGTQQGYRLAVTRWSPLPEWCGDRYHRAQAGRGSTAAGRGGTAPSARRGVGSDSIAVNSMPMVGLTTTTIRQRRSGILGRSPLFLLAGRERWLSAVHPEDRPRVAQSFDRLRISPWTFVEEEYRIVLPDGTNPWVQDSVTLSQNPDGRRCVNGVIRDITARKAAEIALRESEAKFRGIFMSAAVGIALVSPEGCFLLDANPAFCEFLGYSQQELLGKRVEDVTHPDDRELTVEILRGIWEDKSLNQRHEKRYLAKNGQTVWGEVSISLIRDPLGNARYSIAQVLDITERKRAVTTP